MALAHDIRPHAGFAPARVPGLFSRLVEAWQRRKVFRRTLAELKGLSSRELADLGLTRSMITRVALEAAYGK